jgi:hypothetical protein
MKTTPPLFIQIVSLAIVLFLTVVLLIIPIIRQIKTNRIEPEQSEAVDYKPDYSDSSHYLPAGVKSENGVGFYGKSENRTVTYVTGKYNAVIVYPDGRCINVITKEAIK